MIIMAFFIDKPLWVRVIGLFVSVIILVIITFTFSARGRGIRSEVYGWIDCNLLIFLDQCVECFVVKGILACSAGLDG